jgi:hypothetical protein
MEAAQKLSAVPQWLLPPKRFPGGNVYVKLLFSFRMTPQKSM